MAVDPLKVVKHPKNAPKFISEKRCTSKVSKSMNSQLF